MRNSIVLLTVFAAAVSSASAQVAGSEQVSGLTAPASADAQWELLNSAFRVRAGTATLSRTELIARAVQSADRLRTFRETFPSHRMVKEAKRREALALLDGYRNGEMTNDARRRQLVAELRADVTLPASDRAEVAATADNLDVVARGDLTAEGRLAEFQRVVKRLVAEFPSVGIGYESLLAIGRQISDAEEKKAADEVLASPAGEEIKRNARTILARQNLVGASLRRILVASLSANSAVRNSPNRPVIVYSWSTQSKASVALAKRIAAAAPASALLVGVCLDERDVNRNNAGELGLPGEQVYDWMGRRGDVAQRLALSVPGLVYVANATGVITSVSGQRDLNATFAQVR